MSPNWSGRIQIDFLIIKKFTKIIIKKKNLEAFYGEKKGSEGGRLWNGGGGGFFEYSIASSRHLHKHRETWSRERGAAVRRGRAAGKGLLGATAGHRTGFGPPG